MRLPHGMQVLTAKDLEGPSPCATCAATSGLHRYARAPIRAK